MDREIKRIYIGLPEELINSVLWVAREFRTNPLSYEPGGCDVVVEYKTNEVFGYDWIKFPSKYVSKIYYNRINGKVERSTIYNELMKLHNIKKEIRRLFARKWTNLDDHSKVPFKEVWNSESSKEIPWKVLQEYDLNYIEKNKNRPITTRRFSYMR